MENKRIDLLFAILVIAFLTVAIVLMRDSNANKIEGYKQATVIINKIVIEKNIKLRDLYNQLVKAQKENTDLKTTLSDTRNDLEVLSKKLAQPVPMAPAVAAAPVAAAPVAVKK